MTYTDTLYIAGTDVRALPGVVAVDFIDGLYAPGTRRGDDDVIPGAQGMLGAQLPFDRYLISVPMTIQGASTGEFNDNLRAIGAIIAGTNGLVDLSRRVAKVASPGYAIHTAKGRMVGLPPSMINWTTCSAVLQVYNLSGAWYDGVSSTWLVP